MTRILRSIWWDGSEESLERQRLSSFDRGVKRACFAVLREATVPAVLIEGRFLTEPTEAAETASAIRAGPRTE
jgi:N-acetylmuramoyl-L-alanine amidase